MNYAYIRVSTEQQSYSGQEYEIRNWAQKNGITIDKWVSESVSGTVEIGKRKLGQLVKRMKADDLLVCTEISRLGRNMLLIMSVLNDCSYRRIRIHTIKDNFDLSNDINSKIIAFAFSLAAEIERNLISQRTREALAEKKSAGAILGRPRGRSLQKELLLKRGGEVAEMLRARVPIYKIAAKMGVSVNTLKKHLTDIL